MVHAICALALPVLVFLAASSVAAQDVAVLKETQAETQNDDLRVVLEGRNLTNAEARSHVSFLKDVLPLPRRDLRVSLHYAF